MPLNPRLRSLAVAWIVCAAMPLDLDARQQPVHAARTASAEAPAPATSARAARRAEARRAALAQVRDEIVRDAVIAAVRQRMGQDARVTLSRMHVRGLEVTTVEDLPRGLVAVPDAGARVGGAIRFLLSEAGASEVGASEVGAKGRSLPPRPLPVSFLTEGERGAGGERGRRTGSVEAELHVTLPHLRARHALTPRATLSAGDVEDAVGEVGRLPLAPLPDMTAVVGARLLRPVAAGQSIAASMIAPVPLVRSGDEVQTIVRVGTLEARGTAVAAQAGVLGEEIRVVNADSRRTLRGRVIGEREVEVIHE